MSRWRGGCRECPALINKLFCANSKTGLPIDTATDDSKTIFYKVAQSSKIAQIALLFRTFYKAPNSFPIIHYKFAILRNVK